MKSVVISILVAALLAAFGALVVVGMTSTNPRSPNSLPGAAPGVLPRTSRCPTSN